MFDLVLQQLSNGVAVGMSYALLALGLTLIFGVLHVINFAHGEFYMLGGGAAVLVGSVLGAPYFAAVLAAGLGVAVVAWGVNRVAVQPVIDSKRGLTTVLLTTFAVSVLLQHSVLGAIGPAPLQVEGVQGTLDLGPVTLTWQRVLIIGVGVCFVLGVDWVLRSTLLGKQIRAVSQSSFAARAVGIPVDAVRTITFIGAGALAGAAGALLAPVVLFTPSMGQHAVINAFVIVVLGGMGNPRGAVLCALLLGILEALFSIVMSHEMGSAAIYAILLVALLFRPQGLFSKTQTGRT